MSKTIYSISLATSMILGLFAASGCASDGSEPEFNAEANDALKVAFTTNYSEKGTFTVYEDNEGKLTVSVSGAIGEDDDVKGGAAIDRATLADTYRALKGDDAPVPAELQALSDRYTKQLDAAREEAKQLNRPEPVAQSVDEAAASGLTKDFWSQACITFWDYNGGNYKYSPTSCVLVDCPNNTTYCYQTDFNARMVQADRSYGWNATPSTAYHYMSTGGGGSIQIPAMRWTWNRFSFTGVSRPVLYSPATSGQLGLTVHEESVVIY